MDKLNQINKLIDAGFTAAEIKTMLAAEPEAGAAAPQESAEAGKAAPAAQPAAAPEDPAPAAAAQPDPFAQLNKRIDDLFAGMEKIAKTGIMPTLDNVQPLGVDDVLLKFFKED